MDSLFTCTLHNIYGTTIEYTIILRKNRSDIKEKRLPFRTVSFLLYSVKVYYQTWHNTSPPTLLLRASLSVITPLEVETIAIPKPFFTLLISEGLAY